MGEKITMKEVWYFQEDDRKYIKYELTQKELELLSKHFNYQFSNSETKIICIYDYKNNLLAAQFYEGLSIWELSPEEFEKLFKNK